MQTSASSWICLTRPTPTPISASGERQPAALDVEPKVHHVALAHDVLLALEPQPARLFGAGFALVRHEIVVTDDLGANEPVLEVGVDDTRGLWRSRTDAHRPCAHFLGARSEISLQPEERVARADDAVQARLIELQLLQEIRAVDLVE